MPSYDSYVIDARGCDVNNLNSLGNVVVAIPISVATQTHKA